MYSTSSIKTRATWTAFPYNIAWSDETGHFQYCSQVDTGTGKCTGDEGAGASKGPADKDDFGCFPASAATRDPIAGCIAPNYGFDGPPYQRDWPNGSKSRPTPIMFSSPLTGRKFNVNYARECAGCAAAVRRGRLRQPELRHLHRDRLHQAAHHRRRHAGQVLPVLLHHARGRLYLGPGTDVPGLTVRDFGKLNQYGSYDRNVYYTGSSGPYKYSSVFIKTYPRNECPAPVHGGRHA